MYNKYILYIDILNFKINNEDSEKKTYLTYTKTSDTTLYIENIENMYRKESRFI